MHPPLALDGAHGIAVVVLDGGLQASAVREPFERGGRRTPHRIRIRRRQVGLGCEGARAYHVQPRWLHVVGTSAFTAEADLPPRL